MQIRYSEVRAGELKGLHAKAESFAEGFQVLVTGRDTRSHSWQLQLPVGQLPPAAQGYSTRASESTSIYGQLWTTHFTEHSLEMVGL